MSEPEPKEPSFLKKTRDAVLVALRKLVGDAKQLPPVERAPILCEVAVVVAAIETAFANSHAVLLNAELRKLQR